MKHYFKFNASSTQIRTAKLMGKERKGISFPLLPGIITPPLYYPFDRYVQYASTQALWLLYCHFD
jgi:hypothetical protein